MRQSLKRVLGCWANERWKTELSLLQDRRFDWLELCNRHESISRDEVSGGRICHWRDSSRLTVSRVFPDVGRRLLLRCLRRWPLRLNFDQPVATTDSPEASVLVAVGGTDRLRQFRTVLASLRGQSHSNMEIVVVEHSETAELKHGLPNDIRYFHIAKTPEAGFNKSRAMNVAASHARGRYLLIHDADYVVPREYVSECCRVLTKVHGVRPSRFNFHLNERSTFEFTEKGELPHGPLPEYIVQNNPTPMALRADCYRDIGGHDESFAGWGGEDVEFLSRLRTKSVSEGGWLPTIHLWHPPAPKKSSGHRNQQQQDEKLAKPAEERVRILRKVVRNQ